MAPLDGHRLVGVVTSMNCMAVQSRVLSPIHSPQEHFT